ncbi:cytochrome b-c1 complex subunit 7-like [Sitodiplosis mosellana]|uniref:cytochrome b-c1 complex subunit 7-like n=1 Tax=Sitodiplosis mosellana TaxID=263140 RepID=UPI002443927B|nr:cytochrome b-c1 complex subunit 7-like [Sitodiplosis mosellana]
MSGTPFSLVRSHNNILVTHLEKFFDFGVLSEKYRLPKMSKYVALIGPRINTPFRKWCYNLSGFRKYGLFLNDCYASTPEVEEAIRRLPPDVFDARNKRIQLAFHHSLCKTYLPKEQWTKYEEDVKYLEPYLEEVEREKAEQDAYEHNNFSTQ